jgi:hypothetical protein
LAYNCTSLRKIRIFLTSRATTIGTAKGSHKLRRDETKSKLLVPPQERHSELEVILDGYVFHHRCQGHCYHIRRRSAGGMYMPSPLVTPKTS